MERNIKDLAIKRALATLSALNCKYHVIEANGVEHGEPIEQKPTKSGTKYGYGSLLSYMTKNLDGIGVGEERVVSVGEFDIDSIQSSACNYMHKNFGSANYITSRSQDRGSIQVLCLGTKLEAT